MTMVDSNPHPPPALSYYYGVMEQHRKMFQADRLRAVLTPNHPHLCIAMVGLPGRGKSFIARKLEVFMKWKDGGHLVQLFNVGRYRRIIGESAAASFFDPANACAADQRQQAAQEAMSDMLKFFDEGGEVGIFDATNSTQQRRRWIMEQCQSHGRGIAVLFVESICDDPEVLTENLLSKVRNSPDFAGMDLETAMVDLQGRIENYEKVYETISDDSMTYIKLYNLQSKVMCNRAYGRLTKSLLPFLTSIHIAPRPIWLCRSGLPVGTQKEEDHNPCAECRVSPMSDVAEQFAIALSDFIKERLALYQDTIDSANPITQDNHHVFDCCVSRRDGYIDHNANCKVMVSTLPRARATCKHMDHMVGECYAALNPLDKGVYEGLSLKEIEERDPEFYTVYNKDRLHTRFPGGESYADLISRLEPCLIEAEQQTVPVLMVSHISVLQVLYAYYRQVPLAQAMRIRIEPHTVYELSPLIGGSWTVSVFKLDTTGPKPTLEPEESQPSSPVSGDSPWPVISIPSSPAPLSRMATSPH
eukprot:GGOE01006494.1.p1 GENE.GGOE01006494.1~~GGOE01006494.1.p1  ORF type:complete len:530 (-),score=175.52 GGOE01006494.1:1199-2788(-)